MSTVRLAHFSDVHITAKPLGWRPRDIFSKRLTGWINVKVLGRGRRFRNANRVAAAFIREAATRGNDALVFSGDATKMAFEAEFREASRVLRVSDEAMPPVVAVPGNHDYYTKHAIRAGLFEAYFQPWIQGIRTGPEHYPFARRIGHVWLIAANSCTPNWVPIDASGAFGVNQLARLRELCSGLEPGPRILVTHYPLRTSRGRVEHRAHRLRDHHAAIETAVSCGISLWLHGHLHKGYVLAPHGNIPFPMICSGSATQNNRWSYNEYVITDRRLVGRRRTYDVARDAFRDGEAFEFDLR